MRLHPVILYENTYTLDDVNRLRTKHRIWKETDIYNSQLRELFDISFPSFRVSKEYEQKLSEFLQEKTEKDIATGNWVYFPWNGELIHMVNERDYLILRTNRNRNLITVEEQQEFYDSCIGIVGLSVGSSLAVGLAYQGIARHLKLAEFDTLETTNLNRVLAGIHQLGTSKIDIATQKIYEIDPYSQLHLFSEGLLQTNLLDFIIKKPKPKIIFEVIDDFEMKIHLRLAARAEGIPVITPANLGDSVLVDVERYDLDKSIPLFNGILGDLPEEILKKPDEDRNKYAVKMVGKENIPDRAIKSVQEINKTLVGRPQLSSTVAVSGALAAYFARKILLGDKMLSGRKRLSLDRIFGLEE